MNTFNDMSHLSPFVVTWELLINQTSRNFHEEYAQDENCQERKYFWHTGILILIWLPKKILTLFKIKM